MLERRSDSVARAVNANTNAILIAALTALAAVVIVAIVVLSIWGSANNTVITGSIQTIVTVVTLIAGILVTLKVTAEAKSAAIEGKAVSQENAAALVTVVDTVDVIHKTVNSTNTAMQAKIDELNRALTEVHQTLATERANASTTGQTLAIAVEKVVPVDK